jgi:hypothetical protein
MIPLEDYAIVLLRVWIRYLEELCIAAIYVSVGEDTNKLARSCDKG